MAQTEFKLTQLAGKAGMPLMVRIDPGLSKWLRAVAKKRKVTITSVIEVCLAAHLPELEKEA